MKAKVLNIIISVLLAVVCTAQDKDKMLSVEDMLSDMDYYFSSLTDVHPNPFVVLTKQEFQSKIDSIKNTITHPLTKQQFYLKVSSLNKYTDLHTRIAGSERMIKQCNSLYNLPVFSTDGNTVFFYDSDSIKCTVDSINGVSVDSILRFFADRQNLVEITRQYNFLDVLSFYCKEHFIAEDLSFKIRKPTNEQSVVVFKADKTKIDGKGMRNLHLETDSVKGIAVFEISTFMPRKYKQIINWSKQINDIFDTLQSRNIKRLYIDITCNDGGIIALEEYLLNYLINDNGSKVSWDLTIKQSKQRRKQRGNYPYIEDGAYYQQQHRFCPQDVKNKFKGEVYLIQSHSSFSAASTLSSQLQKYRGAKVIGEECQVKAVYTDPIILKLPNSKFLFSCATGFIKNVGKAKQRGVIPDIPYSIYNIYDSISIEKAENMRLSAEKNN